MARPTKPDTEKALSRFDIRLKNSAKARIKARAKETGFSMTDFFVSMALNGEVVVNDNRESVFELALIRQLQQVGQWLNKSFTHRANMTGDLPQALASCLRQVEQILDYVILTLKFHDEYLDFAKAEDEKNDRLRSYPPSISQDLGFQLSLLDNNLTQLHNIATIRDIYPRELAVCIKKLNSVLKGIS